MYEHSNNNIYLGVDIGGSHITAALVDAGSGTVVEGTLVRNRVNKDGASHEILSNWLGTMQHCLSLKPRASLLGIGIAMPGPFDYEAGICLMKGVNKYDSLYNINISDVIKNEFDHGEHVPVKFENDASCFGLAESMLPGVCAHNRVIAVTLGTGYGATFLEHNRILKTGEQVPPDGTLYNFPYLDGINEDYISTAWLLKTYNEQTASQVTEVKEIAERALEQHDSIAIKVFKTFGGHLAASLLPWLKKFRPGCLVIGGSIAKSSQLFVPAFEAALDKSNQEVEIRISTLMEVSALTGAALLIKNKQADASSKDLEWRKTSQPLMPSQADDIPEVEGYDMYPFHSMGTGKIVKGYDTLATWLKSKQHIAIDGYGGNDWKSISAKLDAEFKKNGQEINWIYTTDFLKAGSEIEQLVAPFLGADDSVWGTRTSLSLKDFFDTDKLQAITNPEGDAVTIVIGTGAALTGWDNLVYIDLPKNEIQYRMRAGSATNLGKSDLDPPSTMYKRFYFVDWVVLDKHRQQINGDIKIIADGQWKDTITWAEAGDIRTALREISHDVIRVRPWFEAGAWGGNWMKENIPQINTDEVNYAWSFELIAKENGLVLESDRNLLELSFDWLMEARTEEILGRDAERFGTEFPIRFDFLDTFDGGNLSIQCHPSVSYIRQHFGEQITQDETYYILDCKEDAVVYLGFQENIDPATFKSVLEESVRDNEEIEIEDYVQAVPAHKHDLFLIPNGTVHSAGVNNMVLEISAAPYIFTFKMYDWVRLDLEGKPRPINIDHAFNNLKFDRKGSQVRKELISVQTIKEEKDGVRIVNLSTHADHFYNVERLEFQHKTSINTNNRCHVLMLVEGTSVTVTTKHGKLKTFAYAETFIIPAAAESYEIKNNDANEAKVIKAFIK